MIDARSIATISEVVIVEALRSPIGRRGGGLSTIHPADLLGAVIKETIGRAGIDPAEVGQVVGGLIGGAIFNAAGDEGITDFGLRSILVAFVGASVLLLLTGPFLGRRR